MGLIREPKNVDFTVQSEPWTNEELIDFRRLMATIKAKNDTTRRIATKSKSTDKSTTGKKQLV